MVQRLFCAPVILSYAVSVDIVFYTRKELNMVSNSHPLELSSHIFSSSCTIRSTMRIRCCICIASTESKHLHRLHEEVRYQLNKWQYQCKLIQIIFLSLKVYYSLTFYGIPGIFPFVATGNTLEVK